MNVAELIQVHARYFPASVWSVESDRGSLAAGSATGNPARINNQMV
jgi:hypothetical protein